MPSVESTCLQSRLGGAKPYALSYVLGSGEKRQRHLNRGAALDGSYGANLKAGQAAPSNARGCGSFGSSFSGTRTLAGLLDVKKKKELLTQNTFQKWMPQSSKGRSVCTTLDALGKNRKAGTGAVFPPPWEAIIIIIIINRTFKIGYAHD